MNARRTSRPPRPARPMSRLSGAGAGIATRAGKTRSEATPHIRFNATQMPAVRARPRPGTSQNAAATTPATAPNVLLAYSPATERSSSLPGPRSIAATMRSIAGSVAPIAAVAGRKSRNVPPKATRPLPRRGRLGARQPQRCRAEGGHRQHQQQGPERDGQLASGIPARGARAGRDARAKRERAHRQPAEERRHHRQHGGGLVTQPQGALLRPDDLIAEPREARRRHQEQRRPPAPAVRGAGQLSLTT